MTLSKPIPEVLNQEPIYPTIKFHNKFLGAILSGDKVSTIRTRPFDFKIDGIVLARFTNTDMVIKMVILDMGTKRFKDLTIEDAYYEGYNNLQELTDELENIYPNIKPRTRIYYYRFTLVGGCLK